MRSCSGASAEHLVERARGNDTAPSPSDDDRSQGTRHAAAADRLAAIDKGQRPRRTAARPYPGTTPAVRFGDARDVPDRTIGDERRNAALLHAGTKDVAEYPGIGLPIASDDRDRP